MIVLLFLFSGIFYTSCTHQLSKPSPFTLSIDFDNLLQDSFKLYHQGRFNEAVQKFELASKAIPKDPPSWSAAIFYSILALFQEKSGDTTKSSITFEEVKKLLVELKWSSLESEMQAKSFTYYARQLKGQDQIYLLQKLVPLARASQGKAGEAFFRVLISEAYINLNNFQEAHTQATEALKLSKEVGDRYLEVFAMLNVSGSLVALGKAQEAVTVLHLSLDKVKDNSKLKANILAQLGLAHGALGIEEPTLSEFKEAFNLASSIGDRELVARFHWKFGLTYSLLNKPNEAIEQLTEAIKIFEQLKDSLAVAILEGGVANNYFQMGAFEDANRHALGAAEIYNRLGNRIEEAKNLRLAGQSWGALSKIDDALKALEKAALIQVDEKDRDGVLETLWAAVLLFKSAGRIRDVRQVLLIGLKTHTSVFIGDGEGERKIRWELAKVCDELGLFSEALEHFDKVFSIYDKLGDKKGKILTLIEMAQIYAKLNDFRNRIDFLLFAERLGAEIDDPFIKGMILTHTATLFAEAGDKVEALQRYLESLKISRLVNKQTEMLQPGLVGHFYQSIGEYTKALQYFEDALKLAKEIGDRMAIALCLESIGNCYLYINSYNDAIRSGREAVEIIRGTKTPMIQMFGFSGLMFQEFRVLGLIGFALAAQKKYEDALNVFEERFKVAEKSGDSTNISDAYNNIGYIYLEMGKYAEAIEHFKKAVETIELIRLGVSSEEHKMGFFGKHLVPYDGVISAYYQLHHKMSSIKSEFAEEALNFAEKSKSRTWLTQLLAARARLFMESVPLEIQREELDLLSKVTTAKQEYENALTRLGISAHEIEEKKIAGDIAYEKWNSFTETIRRDYPKVDRFFALFQYSFFRPIQLNELTIKSEETLILYKVTLDWVYAWVVIRTGHQNKILKFTQLPSKTSEIKKIIEKLLLPYERGKYKEFDVNISNGLYDKILRPVIEGVEMSKRVIIIPDGLLNAIPFEFLVTRMGCNDDIKSPCYFGDQFIVSYYPSATILTLAREATPEALPPQGSLFAVGDPIYGLDDSRLSNSQVSFLQENEKKDDPEFTLRGSRLRKGVEDKGYSFERLKNSGLEVQKIKDIFKNSRGDKEVLVGFDASEGSVKSRDLTKYQYLHFAVHGILAFDVPYLNEPALVLAVDPVSKKDGFLTLSDIYGLKLNADLVTLSACKTGLGQRVAGEGVIGLSRAFINAGARAVLVSLWEVPDESTSLLMGEFYQLLSLGVDKVEALKKAKRYLRDKGYENPYFWAPFILIGD